MSPSLGERKGIAKLNSIRSYYFQLSLEMGSVAGTEQWQEEQEDHGSRVITDVILAK